MNFVDLKEKINNADHNNDLTFQEIIIYSLKLLHLSEQDLAIRLGCSTPSISRWVNGNNAAHPAIRKYIYNVLLDKINIKENE